MVNIKKDYWEFVYPTYLENIPDKVLKHSIPSLSIKLTKDQTSRLIKNNGEFGDHKPPDITDVKNLLQKIIDQFPNGTFIKLGSRSPKDSFYGFVNGFKSNNSEESLNILLGGSERIYEDLTLALNFDYNPHIWVREYIDIEPWSEFRCFVKDNNLVGISQYNYLNNEIFDEIINQHKSIEYAILSFFNDFIKDNMTLENYIFDVFVKYKKYKEYQIWDVKLIEINPWLFMTDPCLYKWDMSEGKLNIIPDKFFIYNY